MSRDDSRLAINQHGIYKAELSNAGCDLRDLRFRMSTRVVRERDKP